MRDYPNTQFRCLIAGGDGTVIWVVEECIKNNINVQQLPFGIVPLGTGNDFSRTMGWGGEAHDNFNKKKDFMDLIRNSYISDTKTSIKPFDIWEV
jgi:diacylglycerol kinase (ATP)